MHITGSLLIDRSVKIIKFKMLVRIILKVYF
ncbi:hypothetical protein AZ021_002181 [Enterobacter ludwigii]|jgi:hypothetical protein|nr:hypothetical protein M942_15730 [Enterobacter ludwigii]MDR6365562.1 hypothetical protein [Enterobacter sp. SORGH_AS_0287]OUF17510.1 hypothetical protein AZ021_002181 [Enterobacter ludwigii]CZX88047.1 Uncharacterised protein [Enterobacter ludwigii]SAB50258.1 Uncharacterised protein [Enterobacter ludwigii]